jgi:glycerophosphoryl diester phosphodiesterase
VKLLKSTSQGMALLFLVAVLVAPAHSANAADTGAPSSFSLAATQAAPAGCNDVQLTAHRGGTLGLDKVHTEDSLDSFKDTVRLAQKAAKKHIVVAAETDIWRTKPVNGLGTWINNHDPTLDRTTTGKGYIANQTFSQLTAVHYNDGEPLTRFATAVRYMASETAAHFQVELKPAAMGLGSLRALSNAVIESGMKGRFEFTSFHEEILKKLYSLHAGIRIGYAASTPIDLNDAKTFANDILYSADLATPDNVAAAHAAGLSVGVWTLNSRSDWVKYLNNGVDSIITDEASTYYNWCIGS